MKQPNKKRIPAVKLSVKIEKLRAEFPFYISEYINHYEFKRSELTLFNYLIDYKSFFQFLIEANLIKEKNIIDISLSTLEKLKKADVEDYIKYLRAEKKYKDGSLNRKISSLKSLFKFLTEVTEVTPDNIAYVSPTLFKEYWESKYGEPYFYRNVMSKIEIAKPRNIQARADIVKGKIFTGNQDVEFLDFVKYEYEKTLDKKGTALTKFKKNKLRDVAILSVFLGSGLRVSELAGLKLSDINFRTNTVRVLRKGQREKVSVFVSKNAMSDLETYLQVRSSTYHAPKSEQHLWLSGYKMNGLNYGIVSISAIQSLVKKYTKAFGYGNEMSPHTLRHSVGTKVYVESGNSLMAVKEQLGHTCTTTSEIYTHVSDDEIRFIMENINQKKDSGTEN